MCFYTSKHLTSRLRLSVSEHRTDDGPLSTRGPKRLDQARGWPTSSEAAMIPDSHLTYSHVHCHAGPCRIMLDTPDAENFSQQVEIQIQATVRIADLPAIHVFYINSTALRGTHFHHSLRAIGLSSISSRNYPEYTLLLSVSAKCPAFPGAAKGGLILSRPVSNLPGGFYTIRQPV